MNRNAKTETIVFGGGCFWCTEAVFQDLRGVVSVMPGFAGGAEEDPSYWDVAEGKTSHAEVVKVVYDPTEVRFTDLLTVFFATHDPTSVNRQGADVGTQYRSAVFYTTEEQRQTTKNFIEDINNSSSAGKRVVTEVAPLEKFYEADESHTEYYRKNSGNAYCQIVINPKLEKVQREFANLLKTI
ncbi:MAG TPA: peptide-methionine (S)-S-oxide reductase MsrA [Candidatus Paceibacterota bacterium]|nr:peptide-methionine (S)-S-oxide reductase MsrA [Candidatus Paceibacterota bacterium]